MKRTRRTWTMNTADPAGERLLRQALVEPRRFHERGAPYGLLQFYFEGRLSLETLRPLLKSDDVFVQATASFIASELGHVAQPLIDDIIPLLGAPMARVVWDAMDSLTVCATGEHLATFAHVVGMLASRDDTLRKHAMSLVSRAELPQIEAALCTFEARMPRDDHHERGLAVLMDARQVDAEKIITLMRDPSPLLRRYGAIAAKRLLRQLPELIELAGTSDDPDLRDFHDASRRELDATREQPGD
ncbi:hypothetical protein [Chondromyces crocatus]|uniref:HEAT repeat domain-containing protein n=1 Tax=Chondromyces crocatus TaxID=52 RepID=A0A0K1EE82_CHOCO|nr:hypothetical protein [Chondromyces crocatus]AKT39176.1 uncharacterized protein CMC5_033230 [Chondromyces crocatus]